MTAMNKGDANCTTGAALTAYTSLVPTRRRLLGDAHRRPDEGDQSAGMAMVQVLDEIVAHGVAYIPTAQGALQRVGTTDTDPPAAEREIHLR
jgi:hypothetical protein